jgi:hypothetical protein
MPHTVYEAAHLKLIAQATTMLETFIITLYLKYKNNLAFPFPPEILTDPSSLDQRDVIKH